MSSAPSFLRRRTRSTFVTSMVIIGLVLFFIGFFISVFLYFQQWTEKAREEFEMVVQIADHTTKQETEELGDLIEGQPWVASMRYVSKEEAGATLDTALIRLLDGVNPLFASYNVRLKNEWISKEKLQEINATLDVPSVADVDYPIDEIEGTSARLERLYPVAGIAAAIVMLIAFFIINSSVRLAIFSRRLMIRSMQLIGATGGFVRRPFIRMGVLQGFFGALFAITLLVGVAFGITKVIASVAGESAGTVDQAEGNIAPLDFVLSPEFLILAGSIVVLGTFIGWISSWLAVNRFLNKSINELM
jgi:cell division transport system permease protein